MKKLKIDKTTSLSDNPIFKVGKNTVGDLKSIFSNFLKKIEGLLQCFPKEYENQKIKIWKNRFKKKGIFKLFKSAS